MVYKVQGLILLIKTFIGGCYEFKVKHYIHR